MVYANCNPNRPRVKTGARTLKKGSFEKTEPINTFSETLGHGNRWLKKSH
jgi:hypothetical protein